jgi:heat shock protein HslJ
MRVTLLAVTALLAAPTGCAQAEPVTLAGTAWELVSIQSTDGAEGTTTVPDPSTFTVAFGIDGRASFRLDCNRGTGTWTSEAGAEDTSGSLTLGPIATTRMACLPSSLDQQVTQALGEVRSYLLKDGQLRLSGVADGEILTWRQGKQD